jgi:hypothetical protein
MSYQWVKASELAEYVYCSRAWHLRHQRGAATGNVRQLENGRFHHQTHGRKVQKSVWLERAAYLLLFVTIAAITFQLVGG